MRSPRAFTLVRVILMRPGILISPTDRFRMERSIKLSSSANTEVTCFLFKSVASAICSIISFFFRTLRIGPVFRAAAFFLAGAGRAAVLVAAALAVFLAGAASFFATCFAAAFFAGAAAFFAGAAAFLAEAVFFTGAAAFLAEAVFFTGAAAFLAAVFFAADFRGVAFLVGVAAVVFAVASFEAALLGADLLAFFAVAMK